LAGEIAGILEMSEKRQYAIYFRDFVLPRLENGIDLTIPKFTGGRDYRDPVSTVI
jgi:hypothetical protein